jgi:hypothetical protein
MPSVVTHEPLPKKGLHVGLQTLRYIATWLIPAYHSEVIDLLLLGFIVFALCAPDSERGCNAMDLSGEHENT